MTLLVACLFSATALNFSIVHSSLRCQCVYLCTKRAGNPKVKPSMPTPHLTALLKYLFVCPDVVMTSAAAALKSQLCRLVGAADTAHMLYHFNSSGPESLVGCWVTCRQPPVPQAVSNEELLRKLRHGAFSCTLAQLPANGWVFVRSAKSS